MVCTHLIYRLYFVFARDFDAGITYIIGQCIMYRTESERYMEKSDGKFKIDLSGDFEVKFPHQQWISI